MTEESKPNTPFDSSIYVHAQDESSPIPQELRTKKVITFTKT
jgi:hypothetical protein